MNKPAPEPKAICDYNACFLRQECDRRPRKSPSGHCADFIHLMAPDREKRREYWKESKRTELTKGIPSMFDARRR